jgi:capsular polysaccharide biosynthesis protein
LDYYATVIVENIHTCLNLKQQNQRAKGVRVLDEQIDLRELFGIIIKRAWVIVLITIMSVLISGVVTFFLLIPVYETSTTMMVSRAQEITDTNLQYQDILISHRLVNTYREITTSNRVLYRAIDALGLNMTADEIREMVSVTALRDTEIIKISVENTDKNFAANLANVIAQMFMEEVVEIMRIDNVQIIDTAGLPEVPVRPRPLLNIALAGVLGFMLGLGLVFLIEYLDNTVKTSEVIEKRLELPVIGVIPSFDN